MKVLVTGGAGYIGCLVIKELLEQRHEVVVVDNCLWGLKGLESIKGKFKLIDKDCRNSKNLIYALSGVDIVIHLAGIVGEQACKSNYNAHWTTNIEGTRTLVDCCTDPGIDLVRDFIYISSCSVYGNVKGMFDQVDENTSTAPLSWYADGKLKSEKIIMNRADELPHFHPTILRLTTLFGWSPKPRIDLVTNLFVYKALFEGEITIYGDGKQYRSLIHVSDVAKAIVKVANSPRIIRDRQVFHVGEESNNVTVLKIAEYVKEILPETRLVIKKGAPTDRRDYRISCQKIKNIIGWQAKYSVKDGIEEMIKSFKETEIKWDPKENINSEYSYK